MEFHAEALCEVLENLLESCYVPRAKAGRMSRRDWFDIQRGVPSHEVARLDAFLGEERIFGLELLVETGTILTVLFDRSLISLPAGLHHASIHIQNKLAFHCSGPSISKELVAEGSLQRMAEIPDRCGSWQMRSSPCRGAL